MDNPKSKEESKKQKDDEKVKEEEMLKLIAETDLKFKTIKVKKENILENFLPCIKENLAIWKKKIKSDKANDELYLSTARLIEYAMNEKILSFFESLTEDEKAEINKFFYVTYERISKKMNTLSLKVAKIFPIHQELIARQGVGIVHRSLFSIQK